MREPINQALWQQLTQDVLTEMQAWRIEHPKATLREMEIELDARLSRMRAQMLEDMALGSPAADWADTPLAQHPTCPDCGQPLQLRGIDTRTLQTHGGQDLTFQRRYGTCPACGAGLFPPR
jgi:hypothetical protein